MPKAERQRPPGAANEGVNSGVLATSCCQNLQQPAAKLLKTASYAVLLCILSTILVIPASYRWYALRFYMKRKIREKQRWSKIA